jgi:hypothetical protein
MSDKAAGGIDDGGDLAAFERMLDAFGGDAARWPADRRARAQELLRRPGAAGDAARRALAEARALDRVLQASGAVGTDRLTALADRIAGRAAGLPVRPAVVVALPPVARRAQHATAARLQPNNQGWAAAAVLAASLLVGVVVGPGTSGLPALHDAADAIGLGLYVDQLALAPIDDAATQDEDLL